MKQGISPVVAVVVIVIVVIVIGAVGYLVLGGKGGKQDTTLEETDRQDMMKKSFESMSPGATPAQPTDTPE